jgi:membrane protein
MLTKDQAEEELSSRITKIYEQANRLSFGTLDILSYAIRRFTRVRGSEGAASIAFFTVFAIFPLLLVLVAISSRFLTSEAIQEQIIRLVNLTVPVSPELVIANLEEVLEERGTVGILGLIGLAWSASGMLTSLMNNINRAWPAARPRTFLQNRLIALGMIAILGTLLAVSSITNTILNVLYTLDVPFIPDEPFWALISGLLPFAVSMLGFLALYRWVPNTRVTWTAAGWAAVAAALAWEVTTNGFSWYLRSGFAQFKLVYGSVGTIVAIMLWIYLNSLILIFCAHLSAAIVHHEDIEEGE